LAFVACAAAACVHAETVTVRDARSLFAALQRTLTVLVQSHPGQASGLVGPVLLEPGAP
jgi:hypothetical protein